MKVQEIIKQLRSHPRQGSDKDMPEGAKYIIVSDTLANQMADTLEREFLAVNNIETLVKWVKEIK